MKPEALIVRWTASLVLIAAAAGSAAAQVQPEPELPSPLEARPAADREQTIQTSTTADTGIGEVGQRLDSPADSTKLPPSPLSRIQNRVENRIRNRIDRTYDPTANATAPFERAEQSAAPL